MLNRGSLLVSSQPSTVDRRPFFVFRFFSFRLVRAEKLANTIGFPGARGINRLEQL
jgi:hypothetical protein